MSVDADLRSFSDRQEEEVEVLQAIYIDAFTDLRDADVWKVRRPPEFNLRLTPNHDSRGQQQSEECWAVLHVKLSPRYPDTVPEELGVSEARDELRRQGCQMSKTCS